MGHPITISRDEVCCNYLFNIYREPAVVERKSGEGENGLHSIQPLG